MSRLTIYGRDCDIELEKNSMVENIETYLASLTPIYLAANFQYQKIELNKTIKIDIYQDFDVIEEASYVKIEQPIEEGVTPKIYYYFVISNHWISSSCVQFELSLDTINTFQDAIKTCIDDRTRVIREHKDRFINSHSKLVANTDNALGFKIDETDEGVGEIFKTMTYDEVEDEEPKKQLDWFLVYDSITEGVGVRCRLFPSQDISYKVGTMVITPSDLVDNRVYYLVRFANGDNANATITVDLDTPNQWTIDDNYFESWVHYGIVFVKDHTKIKYKRLIYGHGDNSGTQDIYRSIVQEHFDDEINNWNVCNNIINISGLNLRIVYQDTSTEDIDEITKTYNPDIIRTFENYMFSENHTINYSIKGIDYVDKSDTKLIKIIRCPYCPIQLEWDENDEIVLPDGWEIVGNCLTLQDINKEFESIVNQYEIDSNAIVNEASYDEMPKDINLEPKLMHSSIETLKIVYDSFSNEIKRELFTPLSAFTKIRYNLYFKASNTINSNFCLNHRMINCSKKYVFDFDEYLIVKRNNEEVIYNNDYINYIKNGFNYEKKLIKQEKASNVLQTAFSVVGSAISLGGAIASGGASVGIAASSIMSATTSIANNIKSRKQSEQALTQKLNELRQQSTTISSNDDVNLMTYYCNNRARIVKYSPSAKMKESLFDLFYYCGYATNEQKKPSFDSRYWFNYLQCEPSFKKNGTSYIPVKYINDISARMQKGITIYHRHNNTYDFAQQYENWEKNKI